jgi:hypothetical protein
MPSGPIWTPPLIIRIMRDIQRFSVNQRLWSRLCLNLCNYSETAVSQLPNWLPGKLLLALASTMILGSESHGTHDLILRHWKPSYLAHCQTQSYFTTGGLPPISSSWRQAPWGPGTEFFATDPCDNSPHVTSFLTGGWIYHLWIGFAFAKCTYRTYFIRLRGYGKCLFFPALRKFPDGPRYIASGWTAQKTPFRTDPLLYSTVLCNHMQRHVVLNWELQWN